MSIKVTAKISFVCVCMCMFAGDNFRVSLGLYPVSPEANIHVLNIYNPFHFVYR